jgi:IS30 family transposase
VKEAETTLFNRNEDIKELKGTKITNWMIAEKMGVHEQTVLRYFRDDSEETRAKLIHAINEIQKDVN